MVVASKESNSQTFHFDRRLFHEKVNVLSEEILGRYTKEIKSYVWFNIAFFALLTLEVFVLVFFSPFLVESSLLAVILAIIFLTSFSYFVVRLYFQARKPEKFLEFRNDFVVRAKAFLNYQETIPEHHMAMASVACKFAANLYDMESSYYKVPDCLEVFKPTMRKFSIWWHWNDLHRFRELLFLYAIEEHIKLVKCEPTNLEVHATLANAYVMLSGLYADPRKIEGYDEDRWYPPERFSDTMQEEFRVIAERAIEEFKILSHYAPNDAWVHAQLAYSYHDLQMPEEEIREYETILKLRSNDKETLFKLGMLYFQQGQNAKGLRVYEELRYAHYKKAENLIKFYGSFR